MFEFQTSALQNLEDKSREEKLRFEKEINSLQQKVSSQSEELNIVKKSLDEVHKIVLVHTQFVFIFRPIKSWQLAKNYGN